MIPASRISAQRGALLTCNGFSSVLESSLGNVQDKWTNNGCDISNCSSRTQVVRFYSSTARTYYEVLCISPRSTQAEIKVAYYKLSKQYHPDVTKDDRDNIKFAEISEAYGVLGNRQSRRKYDTGMLSSDEIYRGTGAVSDVEYREFMRQRGQFAKRGMAPTGRSQYYDFDKFYQMHYGEKVRTKKKTAKALEEEQKNVRIAKQKYATGIGLSVVFLSLLLLLK